MNDDSRRLVRRDREWAYHRGGNAIARPKTRAVKEPAVVGQFVQRPNWLDGLPQGAVRLWREVVESEAS